MNERPRLPLELGVPDRTLQALTWLALLWLVGSFLLAWPSLPDRVPVHFDVSGEPDRWGDKGVLLILPVVATACFALLSAIARVPHLHNYVIPIHEGNAAWAYGVSSRGVRALNLVVTLLFALLTRHAMIASTTEQLPSPWLIWIPVVLTIVIPIWMFIVMLRGRDRYESPDPTRGI